MLRPLLARSTYTLLLNRGVVQSTKHSFLLNYSISGDYMSVDAMPWDSMSKAVPSEITRVHEFFNVGKNVPKLTIICPY